MTGAGNNIDPSIESAAPAPPNWDGVEKGKLMFSMVHMIHGFCETEHLDPSGVLFIIFVPRSRAGCVRVARSYPIDIAATSFQSLCFTFSSILSDSGFDSLWNSARSIVGSWASPKPRLWSTPVWRDSKGTPPLKFSWSRRTFISNYSHVGRMQLR